MSIYKSLLTAVGLFVVASLGAGCKTQAPYDIQVGLSEAVAQNNQKVEIHFVATSRENFDYWRDLNVNDYWRGGAPATAELVKTGMAKVFTLSGPGATAVLAHDDPAWAKWTDEQKVYAVIILCSVPPNASSAPGEGDTRRKILYIRRSTKKPTDIQLIVIPSGLMYGSK